jgi:hypothetical protein
LTDATIHQYGDPFTFLGLKLAVRKQLAGSCRRAEPAAGEDESPVGGTGRPGDSDEPGAGGAKPPSEEAEGRPSPTERPQEGEEQAPLEVPSSGEDGRMTLLGIALLLLTLGSGGWAARRAFTD